MPIYEYKCEECGKVTEVFLKSKNDKENIVCKYCGSNKLKKMVSAPGAVIMGTSNPKGTTCCGRTERCDTPPCSDNGVCKRG
jgi:putative FmdB family regulatory protein